MSKSILIPVDLSQKDAASAALSFARQTLQLEDSKLILLNVIEQIPTYVAAELPREVLISARTGTEKEMAEFAEAEGLVDWKFWSSKVTREGKSSTRRRA